MTASIIIPNFNGEDLLKKNLASIVSYLNNSKNKISEIIVVDDNSSDNSIKFLLNNFKNKVKIIKHTKTRGFSATINTGVRASKGDLILLLKNNFIPKVNFAQTIEAFFKDPKVFKSTIADGEVIVYRKSIWQKIGGMDETLYNTLLWEDVDISYRAAKRGYVNSEDISLPFFTKNFLKGDRNQDELFMIWKNMDSKVLLSKYISKFVKSILTKPTTIFIMFKLLVKFGQMSKLRRKLRRESKVSDEAIFSIYNNK